MDGRAVAVGADLTDPVAIGPMMDEVAVFAGDGGLHVLVNNAGVYPLVPFERLTAEEWDRVFALNARAPFLVTQAALPHLRRGGKARVVNIGSVMFHRGAPGALHYVASKGAVIGLTHSLARALGPDGITVNCLVPSIVGTETVNRDHAGGVDAIVAEQAVGGYQQPGDLVGAILWLASPASAFTTGQTVMADGGRIFL
jgi:NAD(P)-dependent dehydrogenase (short-subunit alcohol dehydrogenase family)